MKTQRIKIKSGEKLEIAVKRTETPTTTCDQKRTGVRAALCLVGPVTVCLVRSPKQRG